MTGGARIILTRPLEECLALKAQLQKEGISALLCPMLRIEPNSQAQQALNHFASLARPALIMASSARAFTSLRAPQNFSDIPLYLVGKATHKAAQDMGWRAPAKCFSTAAELFLHLKTQPAPAAGALYLRGKHITLSPADELPQWRFTEIITYEAVAEHRLTPEASQALNGTQQLIAMLYSERSAACFEQALAKHSASHIAPLDALCLSEKIMASLNAPYWRELHCAKQPNQDAMLACAKSLIGSQ